MSKQDIPSKVLELNLFIKAMNEKLQSHLKSINSVDLQLLNQLKSTVDLITELLNGCTLLDTDTPDVSEMLSDFQIIRRLYCHSCEVDIKFDLKQIQQHLERGKHKGKNAEKVKSQNIATKVYTNSNMQQSNTVTVSQEVTKKQANGKNNNDKSTNKLNKRITRFLRDSSLEELGQKLTTDAEKLKLSTQNSILVKSVTVALKPKYPKVKVYPFGSRISGLGTIDSDLDLYVDLDEGYFNTPKVLTPQDFKSLESCLKGSKEWKNVLAITEARTPIVQAVFKSGNIHCDLSFANGLSHCNTRLIEYFISLQPLFSRLALVIKLWASEADIKMNSYILTLLLVFCLQQEKVLPSVYELQNHPNCLPSKPVGYWFGHFTCLTWPKKAKDFNTYLIKFFDFYGNKFDFKNMVVCTFLGEPVKKNCFEYGKEQLPDKMEHYIKYMKSIDMTTIDRLTSLFAYEKPMVVQDPFELIHNVTKGVKGSSLERFIVYCRLTADYLKSKRVL